MKLKSITERKKSCESKALLPIFFSFPNLFLLKRSKKKHFYCLSEAYILSSSMPTLFILLYAKKKHKKNL